MPPRPLLQRLAPSSVAVFRARQLGDMLCAVPALRALRGALPAAHIALVGLPWARQFADRFHRYLDEFIAFPGHPLLPGPAPAPDGLARFLRSMRARGFELALQLHDDGEVGNAIVGAFGAAALAGYGSGEAAARGPGFLLPCPPAGAEPERLLRLVEALGAQAAGSHPEFPLSAQDERELEASGLAHGLAGAGYFCIHPGARRRERCWPPPRFAEVGDSLAAEFGLTPVLTGAASEADLTAEVAAHMRYRPIDTAAPLSIGAMAVLMRKARLLLCNDTGVSQVAAGLRLASVVVFSKADIARRAPLDRHRHRCIWDPAAERAAMVLQHARVLLSGMAPSRQRSLGMWPYW